MGEVPAIKLRTGDGVEHEITPLNSALFTFAGELASRNHIYIHDLDDEGAIVGAQYLFAPTEKSFAAVSQYMIENGYLCHLNARQISDADEQAFAAMIEQAVEAFPVPDALPDDFQ